MIQHPSYVIPTLYRDILFRGRVEARWAVFMDHLRVPWVYEQNGFSLGIDIPGYSPDFWLPTVGKWIEYKPMKPTAEEWEKAHRLALFTKKDVAIFWGSIESPDYGPDDTAVLAAASGDRKEGWWWCECEGCHRVGIEDHGRASSIGCGCGHYLPGDQGYNFNSPRLIKAYETARRHKFWEHKEGKKI